MPRIRTLVLHAVALAAIAPFTFVFFFMVWNSFKPDFLFFEPGVWLFEPTLSHYQDVIEQSGLLQNLTNSLIVSSIATVIGVACGLMTAYTIARYKLRKLALAILFTRMVPYVTMLIPLWLVFSKAGLTNTIPGLVLAHLLITIPLGVWILIAYVEDIPKDLEDAALLDGASRVQAFWYVVVPLCRPGVIATAILCFIFSWNNFQFALVLGGIDVTTAPVSVFQFAGADSGNMGSMLAAATLVTIPGFILVLFAQKQMAAGLTVGGISK
ncbi:MAG TPA: carbohydrate ABC transporter permease [Arsenicitalea sp.]|nr:carbohydrate ABC transporter permease [Arsenicitalea sp.]